MVRLSNVGQSRKISIQTWIAAVSQRRLVVHRALVSVVALNLFATCLAEPLEQDLNSKQAIAAATPSADLTSLFDQWLRDTFVFRAPDGWYYLTGTLPDPELGHCWATNPGIPLWRSRDLKTWEELGLIWSFERDGTWDAEIKPVPENHWEIRRRDNDANEPVPPIRRAAWAPEIHFFDDTYWLTFSLNWTPGYGTVLVRSKTGKPEGPYAHVADGPITPDIDSSLFVDDDGTVYFI